MQLRFALAADPFFARCHGAQVVRVDSDTHVTIKLMKSPHVTYSSDAFRLRHMTPPDKEDAPKAAGDVAVEDVQVKTKAKKKKVEALIDGKPLAALKQLVAADFGAALEGFEENASAAHGTPLFARFSAALAATADTHHVKFLLHGTAEDNVDSVLAQGLRHSPSYGTKRWFTDNISTSDNYAKGALRRVVFAVLVHKTAPAAPAQGVYTITQDEHHLPLFVARRARVA